MTAAGLAADLDARLAVAVDTARAAGELLLEYQTRRLTVLTKSSTTDTVSEADHASEVLIMQRLRDAFPDDGLLGEEARDDREGSTGLRWVVDPLDGTVNYLHHLSSWCVSIACEDVAAGASVVGVVHHPLLHETFVATRGGGARLLGPDDDADAAGTPLQVSAPASTELALVATGFAYDRDVRADQDRLLQGLATKIADLRRLGAAALDLAWVAAGRLDGFAEHTLSPWDRAAGTLMVEEAGGRVEMPQHVIAGAARPGTFAGSSAVVELLLEHYREVEA